MRKWHVWTIVSSQYKNIEVFLNGLDEVEDFVYPTIKQDYNTKSGVKTKKIPLYSSYVFIKYNHNDRTSGLITCCPWIKNYIGPCSDKEMKEVVNTSKMRYEDLVQPTTLVVGGHYKMKADPFNGKMCRVCGIVGDKVTVSVEIFGSERLIKCAADDLAV